MEDKNELSNHKLMNLTEEKRDRIINAALKEFKKGFKQASTDNIVKEAGISKGALFHYFGSKKDLYLFLWRYCTDILMSQYFNMIITDTPDFLERLTKMVTKKFKLMVQYPTIFDFALMVYKEKEEVGVPQEAFKQYLTSTQEIFSDFFSNIDYSKFKEGIDPQMAMNSMMWTLNGYVENELGIEKEVKDYTDDSEIILKRINEYADMFRKTYYQ